jgi:hypothetical protein
VISLVMIMALWMEGVWDGMWVVNDPCKSKQIFKLCVEFTAFDVTYKSRKHSQIPN